MSSAETTSGVVRQPSSGARSAASDRRAQRRLQHQDLSRTQLLDAAEEVFGRRGFHDTTLKEIAGHAGFSVGSVYSFFASKDDLFASVFLRRGGELLPAIEEIVGRERDPIELLHELVDLEIGFFRHHPHFGRLYLRTSSAGSPPAEPETDLARLLAPNFSRAMELQAALFERGQRLGVLRDGDPAVLSRLFSGIMTAYQSLDPAVVDDEPNERLSLVTLHEIVEAAFARTPRARR